MDAQLGEHFTGGAADAPAGFFSTAECACGCGNLLTQKTVNRGWTVIRGHKLKMAGIHHNKAQVTPRTAHHPKTVASTNMDSIDKFVAAELQLVVTQLEDALHDKKAVELLITQLTRKKEKVLRALEALRELK